MEVLVTGAAGFIGANVSRELINTGYKVIGVDNVNNYYDTRLKEYRLSQIKNNNFVFYKNDIEDKSFLSSIFKKYKFQIIFNLAAKAGVRNSIVNPTEYISTNTQGTLNILENMVKFNVPKIVLASTSSLYANQKMPFLETLAVNEPISPYAASKKAAELMSHTYHFLYKLDVSIVRYFTVYGPAGRPDMCIFRFIKWIDEGTPITLYGDGSQGRDFTYVEDVAKGTVLAGKNVGFQIINIGGGQNPLSLIEVISLIEKYTGKKCNIENKDFHKTDIHQTYANIEKAKKILSWKPQTSFEIGLKKTIDWYYENKELVRNIKL